MKFEEQRMTAIGCGTFMHPNFGLNLGTEELGAGPDDAAVGLH